MVITMDWYQGSFHPVLPSITHPQQTWDSVELGQWLTPQMAWIQSKPTMIQGEIQYSSPGKNNQYRIPEQVRSGLAGHSPAGNGLPGNAWLNPSQQCTLITEQTEHWALLTGQHMEGLFCSPLLKSGYSPVLAPPVQKGCGETGTGPLEGCQTGYPENMTYRKGGESRACESGTEESECGLHATWLLGESYTDNGAKLSQ